MASDPENRNREVTDGPVDPSDSQVTGEVGDEGGSPGEVEIRVDRATKEREAVVRDEEGSGKRSP